MQQQPDGPRYVLLIRLPRSLEVHLEDDFLSLSGATKPVMGYHVTVLGPFFWLGGTEDIMRERVAQECRQWSPFRVQLRGVGAFRASNDNVVYVKTVRSPSLLLLHRRLRGVLGEAIQLQRDDGTYAPHVTLGLGLSDRELEAFMSNSGQSGFAESFDVHVLGLAEQMGNDPWKHVHTYQLGSSPDAASDDGQEIEY